MSTLREIVTTSFAQWIGASCGNGTPRIRVDDLGDVECESVEYNQDGGNVNVIVFRERTWPHRDKIDALALTTVTYDVDTREIVDADIEVNGTVLLVDDASPQAWFDLQGILTHEAGHFLGLAHTTSENATMVPEISAEETMFRDLEPDDRAGICSVYPPGTPVKDSCNPIPKHGFSDQCEAEQTHGDCSVATPGDKHDVPAWMLVVALVAGRLQRPSTVTFISGGFVGRDDELAQLEEWLEDGERLVTITGLGGIGKSRLAHELSQRREGAVMVDASAVQSAEGLSDAVADALGLANSDHVASAMAERGELVLIVDDMPASPVVLSWLAAAPELQIVATSRARLALADERVVELSPLPADAAVELLSRAAERIGAPRPAGHVALAICRALDAIPLAIEIVSARLSMMSADDLLSRVRAAPGALDAVIESSWQTLTEAQQAVLWQCTVFAGGFTVAAAEQIVVAEDVLSALQVLRDRSLLIADDSSGTRRLDMYATVRAFAEARFGDPAGQRKHALRLRHAEHYAQAGNMPAERANLTAVMQRAVDMKVVDARTAAAALRCLLAVAPWLDRGAPLARYAALLEPVLKATRESGADPLLIARAYAVRGRMGQARDLVYALSTARTLRDRPLEAQALSWLGDALLSTGDAAAAVEHFRQAASIYDELDAPHERALAELRRAAVMVADGDSAAAQTVAERARAQLHASGDADGQRRASALLAEIALDDAQHADARPLATSIDDDVLLARIDQDASRHDDARRGFEQATQRLKEAGALVDAARCAVHHGVLCREMGLAAEAHTLLGFAERALESDPDERAIALAHLAALEQHAGANDVSRALIERARAAAWSKRSRAVVATVIRNERGSEPPPGMGGARLRAALRCLHQADGAAMVAPADALLVASDGRWFRPPGGERVSLERRRQLALILACLAREHGRRGALTWEDLLAAGWPGEKVIASAAAHRVRVAISTLRKLGLKDVLETVDAGYALKVDDLRILS